MEKKINVNFVQFWVFKHVENFYDPIAQNLSDDNVDVENSQIDISSQSLWSKYKIASVPGDGHCLMHALSLSLEKQLSIKRSVSELLYLLQIESITNKHEYMKFLTNEFKNITHHMLIPMSIWVCMTPLWEMWFPQ